MQRLKDQRGFTAFEIIIVIVALTAIGGAGYFAYQARQSTNSDYSVVVPHKQKSVQASQPTPASTPKVQTFVLKEWGVKFQYSNNPSGLTYEYGDHGGIVNIIFGSSYLTSFANARDSSNSCNAESLGILGRDVTGSSTSIVSFASPGIVAHVGQYYYHYSNVQNACSSNADVQAEQRAEATALVDALKSLQSQ